MLVSKLHELIDVVFQKPLQLFAATLNNVFLYHHDKLAEAHFTIERLCLTYGEAPVRKAYAAAGKGAD